MDVVPQKVEEEAARGGAVGTVKAADGAERADDRERKPSVAVVILNWNGRYFLEKFLPSVYNSVYPNVQFVVGDNGSDDDSVTFVEENYPSVRIVRNDRNYGFAEGYNRVLAHVEADYYVLLNSDVEVTPGWIDPVIAYLEAHPDMAAAQPKILSFHDRHQFEYAGAGGGFLDAYGFPFCRGRVFDKVETDRGQYDDACEVFWATGAAFFIRRRCWEQSGGFDGDFFAHMEEIDLCWRLRRLGYRIGYCPSSVVYHVGGATLQKSNPHKTYLNFRNNMIMLQKNLPFWRAVWVIFARLWFDLFALLHFAARGRFRDAAAVSRAHRGFVAAFARTTRKRGSIMEGVDGLDGGGYFRGSVVWNFYVLGRRTFSEIFRS